MTRSIHHCQDTCLKRLQKTDFAAASFVYGKYVNDVGDILKLI